MRYFFVFLFLALFVWGALLNSSVVYADSFPNYYSLPYPGILPDNPLYKLKVIRDFVMGFFISDPVKKSNYNLLMADKRTSASQILFDSGKQKLALDTISKAQNYYELAIEQVDLSRKQGEFAAVDISKLIESGNVRIFILKNMKKYVTSNLKLGFRNELKKAYFLNLQAKNFLNAN